MQIWFTPAITYFYDKKNITEGFLANEIDGFMVDGST